MPYANLTMPILSKLATVGLKKKKSDGLFLVLVGLNLKDETYHRLK